MHLQENTVFGLDLWGQMSHEMLLSVLYIIHCMTCAPANFEVAASNGLEDMKIDYLTFDLGRTKCCPVSYTSCDIYRLLRLMV